MRARQPSSIYPEASYFNQFCPKKEKRNKKTIAFQQDTFFCPRTLEIDQPVYIRVIHSIQSTVCLCLCFGRVVPLEILEILHFWNLYTLVDTPDGPSHLLLLIIPVTEFSIRSIPLRKLLFRDIQVAVPKSCLSDCLASWKNTS